MKTALVLGATGLVGSALVNQLACAETFAKVLTLTRRPTSPTNPKIENHVIDFNHLENHASLFKVDVVFLCLGTTKKQAGSIAAQRIVDVNYQLQAAQLAEAAGATHLLLVSSSGANAQSNNPYLKMKGELEQAIEKLNIPRISIFQPSLLIGKRPETRIGEVIGSWLMPLFCILPGLRRYRPIKGEDVAKKMVQVSQQQSSDKMTRYTLDEIFIKS